MASKFGGVPIDTEDQSKSKFGGIPVSDSTSVPPPEGFWSSAASQLILGYPHPIDALKDYLSKGPPLKQGLQAMSHHNAEELPEPGLNLLGQVGQPGITAARQIGNKNYAGAAGTLVGGYGVPLAVGAGARPVADAGGAMLAKAKPYAAPFTDPAVLKHAGLMATEGAAAAGLGEIAGHPMTGLGMAAVRMATGGRYGLPGLMTKIGESVAKAKNGEPFEPSMPYKTVQTPFSPGQPASGNFARKAPVLGTPPPPIEEEPFQPIQKLKNPPLRSPSNSPAMTGNPNTGGLAMGKSPRPISRGPIATTGETEMANPEPTPTNPSPTPAAFQPYRHSSIDLVTSSVSNKIANLTAFAKEHGFTEDMISKLRADPLKQTVFLDEAYKWGKAKGNPVPKTRYTVRDSTDTFNAVQNNLKGTGQ